MKASLAACVVVASAIAAACSSGAGDDPSSGASASGCFVAFNPAFDGFRTWTSFHFDGAADDDAGVHVSGPRTEYINHAPPHGSAEFPVGTVIVKEVGAADPNPANHHLFAMAKRGCGFDASGAVGWEWMEIDETPGGGAIRWRGFGPPSGENYGGDVNGCNGCHVGCRSNDAVCSSHIVLASY